MLAIFVVLAVLRYVWVRSVWRLMVLAARWRGHNEGLVELSPRSSLLLTVGGVRGAVTLAGTLSVPMMLAAGVEFPERDLLIFIAAGVILLSLVGASIGLPLLLRGRVSEPDLRLKREVREAWKRTAEAAIQTLENQEIPGATSTSPDAAQAVLATEVKSRIMSEYRHRLEIFNDTAEAQALAFQMDQLEKRMRVNALRAQRLELYSLHRHHQIGDDVLRIVLAELDLNEANLGLTK